MKASRGKASADSARDRELVRLRSRLAEAHEALRAIRGGEVDSVRVAGKRGQQVFTLQGAERPYRVLIESMNEGALTLTADKTILYANACFARMVKSPLEQVTGGTFSRFLSAPDRAALRPLLRRGARAGAKIQVLLQAGDGSPVPAQISIRPLPWHGLDRATVGMVVTDVTEARRTEELLRALAHRTIQVQEAERERLAVELHDDITQQMIAVLFSSQALSEKLASRDGPAKREALHLRFMLGRIAEEVERISRELRPSVLDQLGLSAMLRAAGAEFAARTGVAVLVKCEPMATRLPAAFELAFYRIFQEALSNIEKHAGARRVTVALTQPGAVAQLVITDDGIGFDAEHHAVRRLSQGVLGLVGMRERAVYVGGTLTVRSGLHAGTEIEMRVPLPHGLPAAA